MKELLEKKLELLKAGAIAIEKNFSIQSATQNGAIQIVEQLLKELAATEVAAEQEPASVE